MKSSFLYQRHLFSQLAKAFFSSLFALFFLYILIDYSLNFDRMASKGVSPFIFYMHFISLHLSLFAPLSFLLATIKVFLDLNLRFELVALMSVGIKMQNITKPAYYLAFLISILLAINFEWFYPQSEQYSSRKHLTHKAHLASLPLADGSYILFAKNNPNLDVLEIVYRVVSHDDIWYCKRLEITNDRIVGFFVDHITRAEDGYLEKTASYPTYAFSPITKRPTGKICSFYPLSKLFKTFWKTSESNTYFVHKCILMALPLLILNVLLPFVVWYSRATKVSLIFSLAILAFLGFSFVLSIELSLAERGIVPSYSLLVLPILLQIFSFIYPNYLRRYR